MVRDSFAKGRVIASTTSDENRPEEYVIVSRIFPASTEKIVIAVSSMTFRGNSASGDFLTNAAYLRDASRSSRKRRAAGEPARRIVEGKSCRAGEAIVR